MRVLREAYRLRKKTWRHVRTSKMPGARQEKCGVPQVPSAVASMISNHWVVPLCFPKGKKRSGQIPPDVRGDEADGGTRGRRRHNRFSWVFQRRTKNPHWPKDAPTAARQNASTGFWKEFDDPGCQGLISRRERMMHRRFPRSDLDSFRSDLDSLLRSA